MYTIRQSTTTVIIGLTTVIIGLTIVSTISNTTTSYYHTKSK